MNLRPSPRWVRFSILFSICALLFTTVVVFAQTPRQISIEPSVNRMPLPFDRGSAALWQSLKKLHTRASLLMLTAHPDDEDGGMLTYMSRGQGARAGLLTLNRGEGGQNVMSHDYWDALGLVRTEELLSADRYYGVQQYWTRVADYGFSKTLEEATEKWGHDRVLYDAVRVVRMYRPLVVTSVFIGAPTDGHGQHQMVGEITQEVFKAAGDPNVFPDQIKAGLRPWSPLKVYARVPFFSVSDKGMYDYATGKWAPVRFYDYVNHQWMNSVPSTNVEIPEGTYDPMLGLNYLQIARTGLGFQKSQNGGGSVPSAGPFLSPYHRYGSEVPTTDKEQSFFDGIDTSLNGIADLANGDNSFLKRGLAEVNSLVEQAMKEFSAEHPASIAPVLAKGLKRVNELVQQVETSNLSGDSKYAVNYELHIKQTQFNDAIAQALGLSMDATVAPDRAPTGAFARFMGAGDTFQTAIPGQQFGVNVHVANQSSAPVTLEKVWLAGPEKENWSITPEGSVSGALTESKPQRASFKVSVPSNAAPTAPYFSRPDLEQPYYNVHDERYVNEPLAPYPLAAWAEFQYEGVSIRMAEVVQTVKRATGPGTVFHPLVVAPAISVTVAPSAGVVPLDETSFQVTATIHSNVKGAAKGTVRLQLPAGWRSEPSTAEFAISKDGEEQNVAFRVYPNRVEQKAYTVTAAAQYEGHEYTTGYDTVGYSGLRPYNLYRSATYRTSGVDVKVAHNLNVAYVMGTGDEVPQSLENIGINVHFLSEQDLASSNLQKYDAILLGVRTYAARPELKTYNSRLLNYVKDGGVVVVQYNTPQYDHNFGPYPYTMTNDPEKVVDETAKVEILNPKSPVLSWPNKITSDDFNGWVEERGHDFMKSWDPRYVALTETHDPDQDPQKGGLLVGNFGKGAYVYVAYALYRQLPEGVPGAYRIMANLLSLKRNPQHANPNSAVSSAR